MTPQEKTQSDMLCIRNIKNRFQNNKARVLHKLKSMITEGKPMIQHLNIKPYTNINMVTKS